MRVQLMRLALPHGRATATWRNVGIHYYKNKREIFLRVIFRDAEWRLNCLNNLTGASVEGMRHCIPLCGTLPPLLMPGRIILFQQLGGRFRVPVVACAPFVFYLGQAVFDDAVASAEDRAARVDFVKARPERPGVGVFGDDSVEAVRE